MLASVRSQLGRNVQRNVPRILMVGATGALPPLTAGGRNDPIVRHQRNILSQGRCTYRCFSDMSATTTCADRKLPSLSTQKLDELYVEITELSEQEVSILGALVIQVLGRKIFPGEFGRGSEGNAVIAGVDNDVEQEVQVKTKFGVKLVGYDAQAKIKVIKQVRAIAGLGLKEAKDLVESIPKFIAKDLSSEKADELKAQLEAIGAQIEID